MRTLDQIVQLTLARHRAMHARRVQSPIAWRAMASRLRLAAVGCAARGRTAIVPMLDDHARMCDARAARLARAA